MRSILPLILTLLVLSAACKKQHAAGNDKPAQLYPLATGNKWIYVDSFFDASGSFYSADTFNLKAAKATILKQQLYTPLTDIFDDSIFIIRSTDSTVHILKEGREALLFRWPLDLSQTVITNSYHGDSLRSMIYTAKNSSANYPSYRILIIQDDGQLTHYRQQELFFTPAIGIIKGRDIKKSSTGNFYTYDAFKLVAYSLNQ
jgi:hypothetical protein